MNSSFFKLNGKDLAKGAVMALIGGFVLPILAAFQNPDFSIFTADWSVLLRLAENGAVIGFSSYIIKNLFSTEDGKVLGVIG